MTQRLKILSHELAKGETIEAAMLTAGYSPSTAKKGLIQHDGKLVPPRDHPTVAEILASLQAESRARTQVTVDSLSEKMLDVFKGASDSNQWGAAQQALMGLGKLHGLIIDRKNVTVFDKPYSQWSLEEKKAVRDALREHHGTSDSVH